MNPLWILIMFVVTANGSQTAVRVGFQDQLACVAAGKALVEGFQSSPETASAKVVWSCAQDRTPGAPAIAPVPQPPPVIEQPPPRPRSQVSRPRQARTPPPEPVPAMSEEQRMKRSLPTWLGGEKQ